MKTKVGVHEFYPIAYQEDGHWKGFEIELWEEIAKRRGYVFYYQEEKIFDDLLKKTQAGDYHIGMAGITRTVERSQNLDFSFLTLGTGLIVGVQANKGLSIVELVRRIASWPVLRILIIVCVFSLVVAHIYWLIEKGDSVSNTYFLGLAESAWWAFVTFSTVGYGDIYPTTLAGKLFGVFAILSGLAIFGLFIAQLTSSLTEKRLASEISGIDDLKGKRVATKAGTTAVAAARSHGGMVKEYSFVNEAVAAVLSGEADAVVADAPSLQGIKDQPDLLLVGGLFAHQSYAYIAPKASDILLSEINESLIGLRDEEFYDVIHRKYFS